MCIDLHQTGSVGEDSDDLQLIKFWPSCAPGRGSVAGGKYLLQPACNVVTLKLGSKVAEGH